jgi:phosphoribosylanthranilate isomerase
MFRIKICGVTREEDARSAAQCGADAIGLNFYAGSARFVDRQQARRIIAVLPPGVAKVGVFVNQAVEEILATYDELGLDFIQLHGDEPPAMIGRLGGRPVVRALSWGTRLACRDGPSESLAVIRSHLDDGRRCGALPTAVLIDAPIAGHYGGTGQTMDWQALSQWRQTLGDLPLVLAGGLRPENVAEAIRACRPSAVDTASGVESRPGVKDRARLEAFVFAARRAFDGTQ